MIRQDIFNLIGADKSAIGDYSPVACLPSSGYGCVGYFNSSVNENLTDTIVLLNMRLVDLRAEENHSRRGRVPDFNDFLQDVVAQHVEDESEKGDDDRSENRSDTIPLTAIPVNEIAILYPVAHIAKLLKSAQRVTQGERSTSISEVPTFLDFNNKSIVLKVLMTKIW
jgi:hypothetical protein